MFPEYTWLVGLYLGATIGSFLNVVIYRMPLGLKLSEPKHSFCPNCKHQLGIPDLFPLLSWLFLRGKCRHCGVKVPARYFIVELLNGALWAGLWWKFLVLGSDPITFIAYALACSALVAAIFIDLRWYIIPDQINAFLFGVGILYSLVLVLTGAPNAWTWGMPSGVAGALVGAGVIWSITLLGRLIFQKDAMGHGDIKLARGMGAVLFPMGVGVSMGLAIFIGSVLGVGYIVYRRMHPLPEEPETSEEEEEYTPEPISSIFKCGVGYFLLFDIVGLFWPKFYESYFGENPYSVEGVEEEADDVGLTVIPFGPSLAAGAIAVMLFAEVFQGWIRLYLKTMGIDG